LSPPHTWEKHCIQEEEEEEEESRVKEEENSQFIEVHKVDLGGEGVAPCSGAFGYLFFSFDHSISPLDIFL